MAAFTVGPACGAGEFPCSSKLQELLSFHLHVLLLQTKESVTVTQAC